MTFEKRIGERILVEGVSLQWSTSADPRRGLRRRRSGTAAAELRDVSMTGAGVLAPADPPLAPGHAVEGRLEDGTGFVARVRRATETDQPAFAYYGVEFIEVDPAFQDWLNDRLGEHRPSRLEEVWRHAT